MHVNAHLDVDMVALETEDTVTVMLELQAPAAVEDPNVVRPAHTAIVVLDRSGSMSGGRLKKAKKALLSLVARLDDRDTFGLVSFAQGTTIEVPAGPVGALGRDNIARAIRAIQADGCTDLSSGYLRGLQEANRASGPAGATVVLLSDGHANLGLTDAAKLRDVAAKANSTGITTSTIGIGDGYDEEILSEIAVGGSGNHSFALEADAAVTALAREIDGLLSKTVQAASLLVKPLDGVTRVRLLNDLPANVVEGGLMVELGDFYAEETRRLLIEFTIPAMGALGLATAAEMTFTYVELPKLHQHTVTLPVSVNVVPADIAAGRTPAPEVSREKLMLSAQKAKRDSEEAMRRGDHRQARMMLREVSAFIAEAPPGIADEELLAEGDWFATTEELMDIADAAYMSKRMRSDYSRKSRGYKSRRQGGEVTGEDDAQS